MLGKGFSFQLWWCLVSMLLFRGVQFVKKWRSHQESLQSGRINTEPWFRALGYVAISHRTRGQHGGHTEEMRSQDDGGKMKSRGRFGCLSPKDCGNDPIWRAYYFWTGKLAEGVTGWLLFGAAESSQTCILFMTSPGRPAKSVKFSWELFFT